MTSDNRQLSMIGNRTNFKRVKQMLSWLSLSAGQCSSQRAVASNSWASSQSTISSLPSTTLRIIEGDRERKKSVRERVGRGEIETGK